MHHRPAQNVQLQGCRFGHGELQQYGFLPVGVSHAESLYKHWCPEDISKRLAVIGFSLVTALRKVWYRAKEIQKFFTLIDRGFIDNDDDFTAPMRHFFRDLEGYCLWKIVVCCAQCIHLLPSIKLSLAERAVKKQQEFARQLGILSARTVCYRKPHRLTCHGESHNTRGSTCS